MKQILFILFLLPLLSRAQVTTILENGSLSRTVDVGSTMTGQNNTYQSGKKQIFQASTTYAALNIAGVSSDPSTLTNGDAWIRTDQDKFYIRSGGSSYGLFRYSDSAGMLLNYRHWMAGYLTSTVAAATYQPIGSYLIAETDPIVKALTGIIVGNTGSAITAIAGTASQLLRRNAANTGYEFFTPTYISSYTETDPIWTAASVNYYTKTQGDARYLQSYSETDPLALKIASNLSDLNNAATARTNLGMTTIGSNIVTQTNPSAITFPRYNADNTVSTLDAATFRTAIGAQPTGSYLIANQTITLSGDIAGSGATAIAATLPTINANTGTFNNITVNGKGQVTAASNVTYVTAETDPIVKAINGLVKSNGAAISAATAGTDYTTPSSTETVTNKNFASATNTFPTSLVTLTTTQTLTGKTMDWGSNTNTFTVAQFNTALSTYDLPTAVGTSGNVVTSDGTNLISSANNGGWTVLKVVTTDVSNTTTTLATITGLVTGTLTNATTYEVEVVIQANSSSTAGATYAVALGGSGTGSIVSLEVVATTGTATASVQHLGSTSASTAVMTVAGEGTVTMKGIIKTLSAGTAAISIQQAKTTSGTIIARVGSLFRYRTF